MQTLPLYVTALLEDLRDPVIEALKGHSNFDFDVFILHCQTA